MVHNYNNFKKESMIIKKSSEIDSWSPSRILDKEKDKQLNGKKYLNLKLGEKVIDLFTSYNLSIEVEPGDYLKKMHLLLDIEKQFKEYRVIISYKRSLDEYIDYEYGGKENIDISDDELQEEYKKWVDDGYDKIEWSVFLPMNVSNSNLKASAMSDSTTYLLLISKTYKDMLKGYMLEYSNALSEYPVAFKKYLNNKNIKISNKNIELVTTIESRLYRDSKAFSYFKELLNDFDLDSSKFFKKWLKLRK
jgi:hypothetical protein